MSRAFKARSVGAVLLASMLASAASAQRTGSRLGREATAKDAGTVIGIVASCMVARSPEVVRRWLETLPGTPEERKLVSAHAPDLTACLDSDQLVMDGRELAFQPRALRYPVAAALVRRRIGSVPQAAPAGSDTEPWFVAKLDQLAPNASVDRMALILQDFGHCVAMSKWSAARALLASELASVGEADAFKTLRPALGSCLSEGVNIKLDPNNLRRALAEPVYHILEAGPFPSAGATKR